MAIDLPFRESYAIPYLLVNQQIELILQLSPKRLEG